MPNNHNTRPFFIPKEVLKHLYSTMSKQAIAKLFAVDSGTINLQLKKHDIPIDNKYTKIRKPLIEIKKEILLDLYIEKKLSLSEIHDYLGHTPATISRELKRHHIPLRIAGYPTGFIKGRDHGHKKLCELHEKKLQKIRRFCNNTKNIEGMHSQTRAKLMRLIDAEM